MGAQSGDAEALDALLRDVQGPLFRYLLSLLADHHLACDVLQDVFVLVIRKLSWLREPGALPAWAFRIASRQAFRSLSRHRRYVPHSDPEALLQSQPVPEEPEGPEPELLTRLQSLMKAVSRASRTVLGLHYWQDMTMAEVADVLEIPPGTAKARLAYGLATLPKKLAARTGRGVEREERSHA